MCNLCSKIVEETDHPRRPDHVLLILGVQTASFVSTEPLILQLAAVSNLTKFLNFVIQYSNTLLVLFIWTTECRIFKWCLESQLEVVDY